jgi:hypothetical protein
MVFNDLPYSLAVLIVALPLANYLKIIKVRTTADNTNRSIEKPIKINRSLCLLAFDLGM